MRSVLWSFLLVGMFSFVLSILYLSKIRSATVRPFKRQGERSFYNIMPHSDLQVCHNSVNKSEPLECNRTVPTWKQLERRFTMLQNGGYYRPTDCHSPQTTAILIPYRNRQNHLKLFLQHMHPFLQAQRLEYTIYIVELEKDVSFNKGLLMNVGFIEASRLTDHQCFVFHDLDIVPLDVTLSYYCINNSVIHPYVYIGIQNFTQMTDRYFGGVLVFPADVYKKVNGFSNLYWNQTGEDGDMLLRVETKGIKIRRPVSDKLPYESLSRAHELELKDRPDFVRTSASRMDSDGLNSVQYHVKRVDKYPLYTRIYVSVNQTNFYKR